MAVLTVASRTPKVPAGAYWMQTYRTTVGADSDVEWIPTEFGNILAVVGGVIHGITANLEESSYVKNAQGTSVAAGTNPGDLGVRAKLGRAIEVTVLGQ